MVQGGFDYTKPKGLPLMCEEIVEARKGPEASSYFYRRIVAELNDRKYNTFGNDVRIDQGLILGKIEQLLALPETLYSAEDEYVDED